jgi:hypothetical protein
MNRYHISESAEHRVERVHSYSDLEIHHPSQHGHQPGRAYATVDGRREEVLKRPTSGGHLMVSKDFVLTDSQGRRDLPVPSPASGYIGKVDPRNGVVCIYDREGGELIAQVRHMDLHGSSLHVGQTVAYGQPLGRQSGYGHGRADAYAVHTHIDFNTSRLEDFKKYFHDLDLGMIEIGRTPVGKADGSALSSPVHGHQAALPVHTAIEHAQRALKHLGYTGADGRPLDVDGIVGKNSQHAVRQFQGDHGLHASGVLDPSTAARIVSEGRTMASDTHPAHRLYGQSLDAVLDLNRRHGIPEGVHTSRLAGAVTADAMQHGLKRIDRVELSADRRFAFGVEVSAIRDESSLNRISGPVEVQHAIQIPLSTSSEAALRSHRDHVLQPPGPAPSILRSPVM